MQGVLVLSFQDAVKGLNIGTDRRTLMVTHTFILPPSPRQTALDFLDGKQYLAIAIDSFLIDRKTKNRSPRTIRYYRNYLVAFEKYSSSQAVTSILDIVPDFLRSYILMISQNHNPGGVHAAYRSLRAFLFWVEKEELMPPDWKNPINKVSAPFVPEKIIEPITLEDVQSLLVTCKENTFFDRRDKAIIFFLLDTGARAQEVCDINPEDVEINSGKVIIREGKGRKPRYVFIGKTAIKAIRTYLRLLENHKSPALFVSKTRERLTYDGLRQLIQRRSNMARLKKEPTLHDFRRQFALSMLNNGADIFSLQRLMGHEDISILRRYLAQTTEDIRAAHEKFSPVENYSWR
ncbi:MAG: tyrosine-type recombinase/integrase [Bacteroidia bacterium]|nr:tyrosine-type recombinase/integrase [Bacteroidia bacterium]